MSIIIPANTLAAGGFDVDNSLRINQGDSAYLHKTFGTSSDRKKWTYSFWIKKASQTDMGVIAQGADGNNKGLAYFNAAGDFVYFEAASGSVVFLIQTNDLYRDNLAWYHFVIRVDTTQGTAANRVRLYVNGTQITTFQNASYPDQNYQGEINKSDTRHDISGFNAFGENGYYFDGYMAEVVFTDGQSLAPTDFGEFDEDSNIWKPIKVSGLTFGTNGFYLDFKASGNLGNDANGGTDLTEVNLAAADQATDTCTNNFATANPLANLKGAPAFAQGNLEIIGDNSANHNWQSTIGLSSGKWYWEMKSIASSPDTGLMFYDQSIITQNHAGEGFATSGRLKIINNSTTGSAIGSTAQNDIHGMALDLDNGKMFIHRNGTYLSSGDPANGTNPLITTAQGLETEGIIGGFVYDGTVQLNFGGCPAFAISSGNADGDGFGNFEYAPPSGFFALCTKNLAEYG